MNEIETLFFNKVMSRYDDLMCDIEIQPTIGIYRPDFIIEGSIIEIDGHEYHKTKEQRENDYKRERYFYKKGYTTIRFMGTEVFLDAEKCANEAIEISQQIEMDKIEACVAGIKIGRGE